MNPAELRHEIYKPLAQLVGNHGRLCHIEKMSPVPGEPLTIELTAQDPYSVPRATRRYRITIEELDADTQEQDHCPGHGRSIWGDDDAPVTYCDGSCITDEATDADEEPDMIR